MGQQRSDLLPLRLRLPAHSVTKEGGKEVRKQSGGWWQPELYYVRKNYRPLRTIKVKMDYSHRSEMLLTVGVATDPNATRPEKTIDLHHFRWAGDGPQRRYEPCARSSYARSLGRRQVA